MHTTGAIVVGYLLGLLTAFTLALAVLTRFVSSDIDGFRRWLDRAEP